MSSISGPLFGIHARALGVWQKRAEAIADNLANADTPDYKARDVDFRKVLAEAGGNDGNLQLATPTAGQIGADGNSASNAIPLSWRVPLQPSMDGNTVDTQVEQSAYAANSVHYQASLTFISAQINMLRTAITGGGS
ncbi:MAG TPA: flagellar basal body rod protein FlgB [Rhodanobacteraceae bacterium]|nr:flagellar basal body rod protein FlgB [Rhodanobacteraceae bacterium]